MTGRNNIKEEIKRELRIPKKEDDEIVTWYIFYENGISTAFTLDDNYAEAYKSIYQQDMQRRKIRVIDLIEYFLMIENLGESKKDVSLHDQITILKLETLDENGRWKEVYLPTTHAYKTLYEQRIGPEDYIDYGFDRVIKYDQIYKFFEVMKPEYKKSFRSLGIEAMALSVNYGFKNKRASAFRDSIRIDTLNFFLNILSHRERNI